MAEEYFTTKEAAAHVRMGHRALLEHVRAGQLPVVLFGERTRRIRKSDLDKWAARHLQKAKS
jgi:excisionase family DNA binding protein